MDDTKAVVERVEARVLSVERFSSVVTGRVVYTPLSDLRALLDALRERGEALEECADVFDFYAETHRAKCTGEMTDAETLAIAAKVRRNADMARRARAALTGSPET